MRLPCFFKSGAYRIHILDKPRVGYSYTIKIFYTRGFGKFFGIFSRCIRLLFAVITCGNSTGCDGEHHRDAVIAAAPYSCGMEFLSAAAVYGGAVSTAAADAEKIFPLGDSRSSFCEFFRRGSKPVAFFKTAHTGVEQQCFSRTKYGGSGEDRNRIGDIRTIEASAF